MSVFVALFFAHAFATYVALYANASSLVLAYGNATHVWPMRTFDRPLANAGFSDFFLMALFERVVYFLPEGTFFSPKRWSIVDAVNDATVFNSSSDDRLDFTAPVAVVPSGTSEFVVLMKRHQSGYVLTEVAQFKATNSSDIKLTRTRSLGFTGANDIVLTTDGNLAIVDSARDVSVARWNAEVTPVVTSGSFVSRLRWVASVQHYVMVGRDDRIHWFRDCSFANLTAPGPVSTSAILTFPSPFFDDGNMFFENGDVMRPLTLNASTLNATFGPVPIVDASLNISTVFLLSAVALPACANVTHLGDGLTGAYPCERPTPPNVCPSPAPTPFPPTPTVRPTRPTPPLTLPWWQSTLRPTPRTVPRWALTPSPTPRTLQPTPTPTAWDPDCDFAAQVRQWQTCSDNTGGIPVLCDCGRKTGLWSKLNRCGNADARLLLRNACDGLCDESTCRGELENDTESTNTTALYVGILVGVALLMLLLFCVTRSLCRRAARRDAAAAAAAAAPAAVENGGQQQPEYMRSNVGW